MSNNLEGYSISQDISYGNPETVLERDRFLGKYFIDHIEYPTDITENILPNRVLYEYASESFLNGFINYVNIKL